MDRGRWLSTLSVKAPGGIFIYAALGVLLSLPSLKSGFFMDDHSMINVIEGRYEIGEGPLDLYASFLDLPSMPWWLSPESRIAFWRPLASATLWLDHALFGHQAFFYHLHSLVWLGMLIGVGGLLYRRLSPCLGGLSLLLLTFEEAHAYVGGIICNRHALIATVLAASGLCAHLRWREEGWRWGLPLSLVGFALGCLAGETAVAVMAYALAYELFAGPGGLSRRLRAIAPAAVLAVVYLLTYKAMGYGPSETIVYNDPVGDPERYLAGLLLYLPVFMAGILSAVPVGLVMEGPFFAGAIVLTGIVASVAVLWGWRRLRPSLSAEDRRALDWLVPGAFGALLPVASAAPSERQFLVPAIGLLPVLAAFAVWAWPRFRVRAAPRRSRLTAGGVLLLVLTLHLGVAGYVRVAKQISHARLGGTLERAAMSLEEFVPPDSQRVHELVVVAAEGFLTLIYPPTIYEMHHPRSQISWGVLSAAPHELRLIRTGARFLELEPIDGEFLDSMLEHVFRPPGDKLAVGDVIGDKRFEIEVTEANEKGPTRLAFRFHHDLDSPRMSFLVLDAGRFRKLTLPKVGESLVLKSPPTLGMP